MREKFQNSGMCGQLSQAGADPLAMPRWCGTFQQLKCSRQELLCGYFMSELCERF
jgi:hypothetical protein